MVPRHPGTRESVGIALAPARYRAGTLGVRTLLLAMATLLVASCEGTLSAGANEDGGTLSGLCTRTSCEALGVECGEAADGCGGALQCGGCAAPQTCGGGGEVNRCGCSPTTCAAAGANCGRMADGCGGVLDCGVCEGALRCGGDGPNRCGANACNPTTCTAAGAECGPRSDDCADVLDCGGCAGDQTCTATNECTCPALNCTLAGAQCGTVSNECGAAIDCGGCPAGQTCDGNQCATTCGDGACDGSEDCNSCASDCGPCASPSCPALQTYPAPSKAIHVALSGSDQSGDGSASKPYRTIRRGFVEIKGPGAHVIIGPGVYRPQGPGCYEDGMNIGAQGVSGTAENPIVVRAQQPGTVLWSGHSVLPASWTRHSGNIWRFDYSSYTTAWPCRTPSQLGEDIDLRPGVAGIRYKDGAAGPDSGRLLFPDRSLAALDAPGKWYLDEGNQTIYARTSDDRSANEHQMSFAHGGSAIDIDGNSHWIVEGIHFHGTRNNLQHGPSGPSDYVTLQRNVFSSAGDHRVGGDSTNGSHIRIDARRGRGWKVLQNQIYSSTSEMVHSGDMPEYMNDGTSAAPGDLYACNVFDGSGQDDYFARGDNPTGNGTSKDNMPCLIIATESGDQFIQNEIKHCTAWAVFLEWNATGTRWSRNNIHHCVPGAFTFSAEGSPYNGSHLIDNNFIWNIVGGGGAVGVFSLGRVTSNNRILNNTILVNNATGGGSAIFYMHTLGGGTPSANNLIANNIAINTTATSQKLVWIDESTNPVFTNNLYFRQNQSGGIFHLAGRDYASLQSWQALGFDSGSFSGDPKLVDAASGDLHLRQESPAVNAGTDYSASFGGDIDGDDRPSGSWDIGADER